MIMPLFAVGYSVRHPLDVRNLISPFLLFLPFSSFPYSPFFPFSVTYFPVFPFFLALVPPSCLLCYLLLFIAVQPGGGGTPSVGCSCPFGGLLLPLYLRNEVEIGEKADVTPPYGQFAVFFASYIFFGLYVKILRKMSSRIRGANSKNEMAGFSSPNLSESCSKWVLVGNF